MKNPQQTARKRNKAEDPNCSQVIIIESPKGHCLDLAKKVKPKKLKHLVKEISSELPDPKKKWSDSESKKDARTSSPVVIESSSDSELLRDIKKRNKGFKKKKNIKLFGTQSQNSEDLDGGQPGADFHVSKECDRTGPEVDRQNEGPMKKRKKKKKEKRKNKPSWLEPLQSGDSEEAVKQISGEWKSSCQDMFSNQKKSRTLGQKGMSKKVKKKHVDCFKGDQENGNGISKKDIASCVYEGKDAQSGDSHMQQQEDLTCRSEKDSEATKKKKLKKISTAYFSSLAAIQENDSNMMSECSLKSPLKKGLGFSEAPKGVNKAAKEEVKRETGDLRCFSEAGQDFSSKVRASGGKKKKAKKRKVEGDGVVRDDREGFVGGQKRQIKKKRKSKEMENSQDGKKKTKKKKETKVHIEWREQKLEAEDEIKLVAFRKGNCDEVNIDKFTRGFPQERRNQIYPFLLQVRRRALQEEIDRESGKTKTAKEESLDSRLGQWRTAAFQTPEQKAKFHRLLGGFKKGFAPAQSSPAKSNKANMALDRPGEQELQQNLEAEFKKAVEFKHHRRIGLGFQSLMPSGVHIDKDASKSIKFED